MFDVTLADFIIIILLLIECWLLYLWAKEHALLMSIMSHTVQKIEKKIK